MSNYFEKHGITTKSGKINFVRQMLRTNAGWACRAVLRLYERQTADEQQSENTRHWNAVGFNGTDAGILSSFAKQLMKGWTLSDKQMAIVYKKVPKYARQITEIIEQG